MLHPMSPSHWIQSVDYQGANGISAIASVSAGNVFDTPFGSALSAGSSPFALSGYSGETLNWFPFGSGSGVFNANLGYGEHQLSGPITSVYLHNNSLANALLNGAPFGIGASQVFSVPCTFVIENSTLDIHRVQMKVRGGRRYPYRLPYYKLIYAWFHSSSKGKFWWKHVHHGSR